MDLYIDTGDQLSTKDIFDRLFQSREEIERAFGDSLDWERLDDRRASRIASYRAGHITDDPSSLRDLQRWSVGTVVRLKAAITEPFLRAL